MKKLEAITLALLTLAAIAAAYGDFTRDDRIESLEAESLAAKARTDVRLNYAGRHDSTDGKQYVLVTLTPEIYESGMYSETSHYEIGDWARKLDTIRVPMQEFKAPRATGEDAKYYYDTYGLPGPESAK